MKNRPFTIKEVRPNIFVFSFKHQYDMCMHFLRYQEYYESASPKFRGQQFQIIDFMRWYSFKYGKGVFTYPRDWGGFNFPGDTIGAVWNKGIYDRNIYDYEMKRAYEECRNKAAGKPFYILGVTHDNYALEHEIAHGYFFLNPEYKKEMQALEKQLTISVRKAIRKQLSKIGYTPKVYVDETQAYLSTSDYFTARADFNDKTVACITKAQKAFQDVFAKYDKAYRKK